MFTNSKQKEINQVYTRKNCKACNMAKIAFRIDVK